MEGDNRLACKLSTEKTTKELETKNKVISPQHVKAVLCLFLSKIIQKLDTHKYTLIPQDNLETD